MAVFLLISFIVLSQACPSITNFLNGTVTETSTTATFSCDDLYYLQVEEELTCLPEGAWDKPVPECVLHTCDTWSCPEFCHERVLGGVANVPGCFTSPCPPPYVEHGTFTLTTSTANITCDDYHYISGSTLLTCLTDPTPRWDLPFPTCDKHTCHTWLCEPGYFCVGEGVSLYCHKGCPDLTPPEHGVIESWSTYAILTCGEYYYTSDTDIVGSRPVVTATLKCLGNGTWNEDVPECIPHTCDTYWCRQSKYCYYDAVGNPACRFACKEVDPAPHRVDVVDLKSSANFSCDSVYYFLKGPTSITCWKNGGWSTWPGSVRCAAHTCTTWPCAGVQWCVLVAGIPTCIGPCSSVTLPNGQVTVIKETAQFACDEHYYLEGGSTVTCQVNLTWDGSVPTCVTHDCNTWYCEEGRYCVLDNNIPTCSVGCPELAPVPGTAVHVTNTRARYECVSDYHYMVGAATLQCEEGGTWDHPSPSCSPHDCTTWDCGEEEYCVEEEEVPACLPGCPALTEDSKPALTHTFTCPEYEYLSGPETLYCLPTGEWDSAPPQCIKHTCNTWNCVSTEYCLEDQDQSPTCYPSCKTFVMLVNGRVAHSKRTVLFSCNQYFFIHGTATLSCLTTGEWAGEKPFCAPHNCTTWLCSVGEYCTMKEDIPVCYPECPTLTGTPNGSVTLHTSLASYSCDTYYYISGEDELRCETTGEWSGEPPDCLPHDCVSWECTEEEYCIEVEGVPTCFSSCPQLPDVTHGIVTQLEQTATILCDKHYYLNGTGDLTCGEAGEWDNPLPECLVHTCLTIACKEAQFCRLIEDLPACQQACPTFTDTATLTVTLTDTLATFTCSENYLLSGPPALNCLPSGSWDNDKPVCQPMTCSALNCADDEYCKSTDPVPVCYPACPALEEYPYEGGVTLPSLRKTNTAGFFSCTYYYYLSSYYRVNCLPDGSWETSLPHCIPHDCSTWNCKNNEICQKMWESIGPPVCVIGDCSAVSCTVDEFCTFDQSGGNIAVCKTACPDLTAPTNGNLARNDLYAKFACQRSHYLEGTDTLRCIEGVWDGAPPTCVPHTCDTWSCEPDQFCQLILETIPVCFQACPTLTPTPHSKLTLTDSTATFTCDKFHYMLGDNQLNCQTNGYWDRAPPTCARHDCSTWSCDEDKYCLLTNSLPSCFKSCPSLSNTVDVIVVQNVTSGTYSCLDQYKYLSGHDTLYCTTDGTWDEAPPTCRQHTCRTWNCGEGYLCKTYSDTPDMLQCHSRCSKLSAPQKGNIVQYKMVVIFGCNKKYYRDGDRRVTCLEGNWTGTVPTCRARDCSKWTCSEDRYCSIASGLPVCKLVCSTLFDVPDGSTTTVGGTATFTCGQHHYLMGPDKVYCQAGSWSEDPPSCRPHDCDTIRCGDLEYCVVQDGVPSCLQSCSNLTILDGAATLHKGFATFTCLDYHYLLGPSRINCVNGLWDADIPVCKVHDCSTYSCGESEFCVKEEGLPVCYQGCDEFTSLEHGQVTSTQRRARFVCDDYYYLAGEGSVRCDNGSWAGDVPVCVPHDCSSWSCVEETFCEVVEDTPSCSTACPSLTAPQDGQVVAQNTIAQYTCSSLYYLSGDGVLHCGGGTWDGSPPTCARHTCDTWSCGVNEYCTVVQEDVPTCYKVCSDPNVVSGDVQRNQSSANMTCFDDFLLEGPPTIQCTQKGVWSPEPPSCVPTTCEALGSCNEDTFCRVTRGVATCSPRCPELTLLGGRVTDTYTRAVFVCNYGYQLVGISATLTCRPDGVWDSTPPTCVRLKTEQYRAELRECVEGMSDVTGCDDVTERMREELGAVSVDVVVDVVRSSVFKKAKHNFIVNKLLLQELKTNEKTLTSKTRQLVKNIVKSNVEYISELEPALRTARTTKMVALNMRLINLLIRSIQHDINDNRSLSEEGKWRERGRENESLEGNIFTREPHAAFMSSLKTVAQTLVQVLVTLVHVTR